MSPDLWEIVIAFLVTSNLILLLKTCSDLRLHRALLFNLRSAQLSNAHLIKRIFIINCGDDSIAAFTKGTDKFSFHEARIQGEIISYLQDEMLTRQRSGLYRTRRVSNLAKLAGESFRPDLVVGEAGDRGTVEHGAVAGGPGAVPYLGEYDPPGASFFQPIRDPRTRRSSLPDGNNNEFVANYFDIYPLPILHPRPVRPGSRPQDEDDVTDYEVSQFVNGLGSSAASYTTVPDQE